ncbi:hypothetical protein BKA61DRAFT_681898 [Leptodontidium sp. MPI-SDFR-AT-0119]|nr:hypothetical protein BKA61DRAFT_681898 [Leptodontidium sp. MPI-SDFR-AT-0119]
MSALPLGEASPNSVGPSFYNPTDATYFPHETTPEIAEGIALPLNNDTTPGLLDIHFEIGADVDTLEPSYISEDSRFSLLCADIGVLQGEIELIKDAKMKLEFKINELRREMREVEQSYKNIKAQRDSLKAELEQLGFRAILDFSIEGSSKKCCRQG